VGGRRGCGCSSLYNFLAGDSRASGAIRSGGRFDDAFVVPLAMPVDRGPIGLVHTAPDPTASASATDGVTTETIGLDAAYRARYVVQTFGRGHIATWLYTATCRTTDADEPMTAGFLPRGAAWL